MLAKLEHEFLVIFFTIFLFAVFIAAIYAYDFWRKTSLKKKRTGQSIMTFLEYFSDEIICEDVCIEVYFFIQNNCTVRNFPVHPQDNIAKVYGICEEDFIDAIVELAEMCNRKLPSDEEIENGKVMPILLVEDLVRFLSSLDKIAEGR